MFVPGAWRLVACCERLCACKDNDGMDESKVLDEDREVGCCWLQEMNAHHCECCKGGTGY